MRNRRNTVWGLLLAAVLIALVLTGCRAFVPEAVIVNKAPETYIIGAPVENAGGYYHFHVFWYGSDVDGKVERFVWALTDTTLQDPDTTDDEEDQNFNPALDASTLAIGHWTTKTDSIFDFKIDQGTRPSADFTLHMVAQDDMGAYDRTPARLHFFSNTLGNPTISFFRVEGDAMVPLVPGKPDTVGFRRPYTVAWQGETPNIIGYNPDALARVDTVYPFDDGLFGYKWQILNNVLLPGGQPCDANQMDCWHPRRFDEATGDSFSYFGPVTRLVFENYDQASDNPFKRELPSGSVNIQVNSIDVAGVEVANFQRAFSFLVNYDPETLVLDGETDWAHPEDPQVYPYYFLLNDPTKTKVPFHSGDRIPDRSYVVVKALARDNPKDVQVNPDYGIGITGYVSGSRHSLQGGTFNFATGSSALDTSLTWGEGMDGWYADTLGFLVGPRTTFTFNMQAVDEHGRRDGSPAQLSFDVGYPPCVQCIEVLPKVSSPSNPPSLDCENPESGSNACFQDTASYFVSLRGLLDDELQSVRPAIMAINKGTFYTQIVEDATGLEGNNYLIDVNVYNMTVYLHSKDDAREAWADPEFRSMAWRYQVDYDCDPYNQVKDGGGNDDITRYTWGGTRDLSQLTVDPATGVWRMHVEVAAPQQLLQSGPVVYWNILYYQTAGQDAAVTDSLFTLSLRQLGEGTVRAVALDQSYCGTLPTGRPTLYNYFNGVRPSVANLATGRTWRDCDLGGTSPTSVPGIKDGLDLSQGAMESRQDILPKELQPVTKHFRLAARVNGELIDCHTPPPSLAKTADQK